MKYLGFAVALLLPTLAAAEDTSACPQAMICASNPVGVADALRNLGFKGKLETDSLGDPLVSSAAAGFSYDVMFYGCKEHKNCDALQFRVSWSADPIHTAELANKWNAEQRFGAAYVTEKKVFIVNYDVTTVGGLTAKNFEDAVASWSTTLGNLSTFWKNNPSK